MSAERQFVDTNVLVYAHDRSAGEKHLRARALLAELWDSQAGCLSIQVLQEFYVNITRKVTRPLNPADARQIVADLGIGASTADLSTMLDAITVQQRHGLSSGRDDPPGHPTCCATVWSEDLNVRLRGATCQLFTQTQG
jgi:predicted nucleic acid-binding protein